MTPRLVCNVDGSDLDYPVTGQDEARERLLTHVCSQCLEDLNILDEAGQERVVAGLADLLHTDCKTEWSYYGPDDEWWFLGGPFWPDDEPEITVRPRATGHRHMNRKRDAA